MKQWFRDLFSNALIVAQIGILIGAPTSLMLMHVWNQYRLADVGYDIAEATSEHQELLKENKKLTVEARLQGRSDRVADLAREQLGLREVRPEQIVTVDHQRDPSASDEHARLDDPASDDTRPVVQ